MKEDKLNSIISLMTQFANESTKSIVYGKSWSDSYSRENLSKRYKLYFNEISKLMEWNNLSIHDFHKLGFIKFQSSKEIRYEIKCKKDLFLKGKLTLSNTEFIESNKLLWNAANLYLVPICFYPILPKGLKLICIDGKEYEVGKDRIDEDERFGCLAYGLHPVKK